MTILYLDCRMGAAGDMLSAALFDIMPDKAAALRLLNSAGIPSVRYEAETARNCGIAGTRLHVFADGEEEGPGGTDHEDSGHHSHAHPEGDCHARQDYDHHDHEPHTHAHHGRDLAAIRAVITSLNVSDSVKAFVSRVYDSLAEAEAAAHGRPVELIHFHEVGALDAVADITAAGLLTEALAPDKIVISPVAVGSGWVNCAHGTLPVPAPATAHLLKGLPVAASDVTGELCTPTGAALLRALADETGSLPAMTLTASGFGLGKREYPGRLNAVRAILGETQPQEAKAGSPLSAGWPTDTIVELTASVDDMTGEAAGYALEKLFEAGARDACLQALIMKKNRPGLLLTVITDREHEAAVTEAVFRLTTTLGIRREEKQRYILNRREIQRMTPWGPVRVKIAEGPGIRREKPEFEDIRAIADRTGRTPAEILSDTAFSK